MNIKSCLIDKLKDKGSFKLSDAYKVVDAEPHSVRARIYENIGINFERLAKGTYKIINSDCLVIEGDGRDLSFLEDESIDCIITDHPWDDKLSNVGGTRKFTDSYDCFKYTQEDFDEKARVMKDGGFIVEVIPAENHNNFDYLYNIKKMAEKSGLKYYSKVAWKKGSFVSNTGRKSKNTEDIMVFTKGDCRKLRLDAKKNKQSDITHYMRGSRFMIPTCFDIDPVKRKEKMHQAEKPIHLLTNY